MGENHVSYRLLLRQWKDSDRQKFYAINNDADVMRYFPRRFTCKESDAFIKKNISNIANFGWGSWAVELIDSGEFIEFVGFSEPADWHPCAGNIEIGWRLERKHWGHGYATEAAIKQVRIGRLNTIQILSTIQTLRLKTSHHTVSAQHPRCFVGFSLLNLVVP